MLLDEGSRKATVLVVDDENEFRKLLVRILEMEGFCVVSASNALDALDLLRERAAASPEGLSGVDLALLDVALPGMNGMTLFSRLQQDERLRRIPVIFLTGDVEYQAKERAFDAGAVDYITKPFQKKDLILRIKAHIREHWQREIERRRASGAVSKVELSLKEAEQRFSAVVRNSFHLVCELDRSLNITYASPNHAEILSLQPDCLEGDSWPEFIHPDEQEGLLQNLNDILSSGSEKRMLVQFFDGASRWRWLDVCASLVKTSQGELHLLLVSRDITHAKETERYLQHLALHDSLTGLANRQRFTNELEEVHAEHPKGAPYAVIYMDVDNFKLINDRHGHFIGDQVLRDAGAFIQRTFEKEALVISRFGGDEFCLIVEAENYEVAQALGERACAAISKTPILSSGERHRITLSIGIALMEADVSTKEVLSRANTALHAAKQGGKNRCCVYRSDSSELLRLRRSAEWFQRIQEGIEESRFEVWYQPIVDLETGAPSHYEALIRYRDSEGHLHSPAAFLPAAERYSLMSQLDRYIVRQVFADMVNHPTLNVTINLAGTSVTDTNIGAYILQCFDANGVDPRRVVFEITETVFMTNLVQARSTVERLQERGCRFALDDFGSGFSSLNYLRNLPVDLVKIDGSFVREIENDPVNLALLKSINEIAHLLGKATVAEWIESPETFNILRDIGIDYGQGYYPGKPRPFSELISTLPALPKESSLHLPRDGAALLKPVILKE